MKVYAVIEFGGEYEDSWEHIIGVCSTLEIADSLKNKTENSHIKESSIPDYIWNNMYQELINYEISNDMEFDTILDGMKKLFPFYKEEELQSAIDAYDTYDDYVGTRVEEIDFFDNLSDIK